MGSWKNTILKLCIAVLVLNIAVITTSAMSIDDGQDDIIHVHGIDENHLVFELFNGSKPNIDIKNISFEIVEGKAILSMELYGNVIKGEPGDPPFNYVLIYSSDEGTYTAWSRSIDVTPFNFGMWNTQDMMGVMPSSVIKEGSKIVAIFDNGTEGSNNISLTGISQEFAESNDSIIEFWMDIVPDFDDNVTDGNETDDGIDDTNYSIYSVCPNGCNYTSIQAAIDAADSGDLIIVESGIYYENVNVNKQLTLRGTDTGTGMPVVIDEGNTTAINLSANGITMEGFNVTSNNTSSESNGIEINSNSSTISGNIINNYSNGIFIAESHNNTITDNNASHNGCGIYLQNSSNNTITGNSFSYNELGSMLLYNSSSNGIYLNNFLNDETNVQSDNSTNFWNSTEPINYIYNDTNCTSYLGNYWSDYTGNDTDGNGIGDTCYNISMDNDTVNMENPDDFPLMVPFENYLNKLPIANTSLPDLTLTSDDINLNPEAPSVSASLSSYDTTGMDNTHQEITVSKSITSETTVIEAVTTQGRENIFQDIEDALYTINSSWTASPPTINGTLENEEWVNATEVNISYIPGGNCRMMVMNDDVNLYIAIDVDEDTTNDINTQDMMLLGFDGNHDDLIAPYGTKPFYEGGTCVDLFAVIFGNETQSVGGWLNLDENGTPCTFWWKSDIPTWPQVLATGFSNHRVYEYSIPFTTALNVSAGDTVGFNVLINDGLGITNPNYFATRGMWPSIWNGLCNFTVDGDLTLAMAPVSINQVVLGATIHNIGGIDANNIIIQFYEGDPGAGGVQIGPDQTISNIPAGSAGNAKVSWDITHKTGTYDIYVIIDPLNTIAETNESNNQAYKSI
jgi:parallel beta-helix repeat protein